MSQLQLLPLWNERHRCFLPPKWSVHIHIFVNSSDAEIIWRCLRRLKAKQKWCLAQETTSELAPWEQVGGRGLTYAAFRTWGVKNHPTLLIVSPWGVFTQRQPSVEQRGCGPAAGFIFWDCWPEEESVQFQAKSRAAAQCEAAPSTPPVRPCRQHQLTRAWSCDFVSLFTNWDQARRSYY